MCGVESGQLGLLSKDFSVINNSELWHCQVDLLTVVAGCFCTPAVLEKEALKPFFEF